MNDLREQLADLCHRQWSGWMEHLFSLSITTGDGCEEIQRPQVERWTRQKSTEYCDLPKDEQDSDRKEADKFLALLQPAVDAAVQAERERCRREEVEPLITALEQAGHVFGRMWMERDAGDVDDALAAVRAAQTAQEKEKKP